MTGALIPLLDGKEIRVVEQSGDFWMPCKDLSLALGLDRSTLYKHVKRNLDFFETDAKDGDKLSQDDGDLWVNERGLYTLLARISIGRVTPAARSAIMQFRKSVPNLIQRYRKKEIVSVAEDRMNLVHELSKAKEIAGLTGSDLRAMQAAALRKCGLKEYADALTPSLMHGEAGTWLNPTQIGARCGHSAREVNNFLEWHRFQYRGPDGLWRLTDKGELHGEEYEYPTVSKHIEIRIRWRESILTASGLIKELPGQMSLPARGEL